MDELNVLQQAGFQMLLEAIPDATVIVNPAGAIVMLNEQTEQLFGYTRAELQGQTIETLMPVRFRGAHVRQRLGYAAAPHTRTSGATLNLWGLRQDGREFPIDVHLRPLPTHAGTFVVATIQDITERKRMEETLRRNEERWRMYVEQANDLIFTLDMRGLTTSVNRAVCETLGYAPEELMGKSPLEFISPDTQAPTAQALATVLNGGYIDQLETEVIARDGRRITLEVRGRTLLEASQIVGTIHTARNITERKQAEYQLRQTQEFLSKLLEHAPVAIYTHSLDGTLRTVNHMWERFMQRSRLEVTGVSLAKLMNDEAATRFTQMTTQIIATKVPAEYDTAFRVNGELRHFHILRFPLFDDAGRIESIGGIGIDVTEQQRAAETLRESEERFRAERSLLRTLIDHLPDIIFAKDLMGHFILSNAAHLQWLGLTHEDDVSGKTAYDFYPAAQAQAYQLADQQVIETGQALLNQEHELNDQTGQRRWHLTTKVPLKDHIGKVTSLVAIGRDITERKRMENVLRESEERYRIISELISDFAYAVRVELNGSMIFEWLTESYSRLMGHATAEVLAASRFPFFYPEDSEQAREQRAQVLAGQSVGGEFRMVTKSGDVRWVYLRRQPVWDAQQQRVVRFYGVAQDITERKHAEEKLRESEACFRAMAEATPVPMIINSLDEGIIQYGNPALSDLLGEPLTALIGQHAINYYAQPAERASVIAELKARGALRHYELQLKRRDDSLIWAVMSTQVITMDGEPCALTGFYDITERKHAEERERALRRNLQGVITATDELLGYGDLPTFYRRAVELAREQLQRRALRHLLARTVRRNADRHLWHRRSPPHDRRAPCAYLRRHLQRTLPSTRPTLARRLAESTDNARRRPSQNH